MDIIYSASAKTTGGRDGRSVSSDNKLSVELSTPKELGGAGGEGTNPEQLFAAGYSACFIGAMKFVAAQDKKILSADLSVEATVGIGANTQGAGFAIEVALRIDLPAMDKVAAQALIEKAHQVCPYSNATRGNIRVELSLV
ncbi:MULTISPECIES: organic hydroperoxide resistance protein [unclassified Shewanella]|uniref:organic hydroperoxide resistance protein n=1 Tax=unclassified Shewanella TaxID=196818 RepID=UPI000C831455|nr:MULTISPECIES: organic hydroperoxide resistance protein [unclassified Shewanella]MDO6620388.1 organic hydroperoxide resistance protein [Shewanella sp. 6_MG-2023]MDO6639716.1 organic hydroperoxide resistance protein [Shewanella sp. 5_MG-2023]MDO6677657.1 organic hydroperoxide resistance protein [Shewanella sp. 4_MG-2023]MDO6776817.1 organic hydroperoxide resistance protein [Shewanella sp. 3_MG-2023]PMG29525.1 organic hydroperoxide resistance protein [Shewanella sp. 10N.286.52.C2]